MTELATGALDFDLLRQIKDMLVEYRDLQGPVREAFSELSTAYDTLRVAVAPLKEKSKKFFEQILQEEENSMELYKGGFQNADVTQMLSAENTFFEQLHILQKSELTLKDKLKESFQKLMLQKDHITMDNISFWDFLHSYSLTLDMIERNVLLKTYITENLNVSTSDTEQFVYDSLSSVQPFYNEEQIDHTEAMLDKVLSTKL